MISILQMAQRAGTVYVRPDPGGWLARRCVGQPGTPEFAIDGDPLLLVEPVALDPSLVREVAKGAKLHHITGPGMPLRVLPEVGYARFRVDLGAGTVDFDVDSAFRTAMPEGYVLARPRHVAADALLVDEAALDLLARGENGIRVPPTPAAESRDVGPPGSDIVSENQAVERLPWNKTSSRCWLRREGLSVETVPAGEGGRMRAVRTVFWPDVVERLRRRDEPAPAPAKRRTPAKKKTVLGVVPGRLDAV